MKVLIDFDDPDILPLNTWLRMLSVARIQHEYKKLHNQEAVARELQISRYTVARRLNFT